MILTQDQMEAETEFHPLAVGYCVKRHRVKLDLSQEELALRCNTVKGASSYERECPVHNNVSAPWQAIKTSTTAKILVPAQPPPGTHVPGWLKRRGRACGHPAAEHAH